MDWTLPPEAIDKGWIMRLSPDRWPETSVESKTVYFRAVSKGEMHPMGYPFNFSATAEETLCHELAHVHLGHDKLSGSERFFRKIENEAWAYVWARGMSAPREAWTHQQALCQCSIDAIGNHLNPTELKLAYRWVASCHHA